MMLAGSLCTDSVPQAEAIDQHFDDVSAYISSIEPPAYPFPIDRRSPTQGRALFKEHVRRLSRQLRARSETYPNLLIPLEEIGTDPAVALGGTSKEFGSDLVDWYNESWYGKVGPYEPFKGYRRAAARRRLGDRAVSAQRFGVRTSRPCSTAPSVPSTGGASITTRPTTIRTHSGSAGWRFRAARTRRRSASRPRTSTTPSNTPTRTLVTRYGDSFTAEQRRAVIEYLKTL